MRIDDSDPILRILLIRKRIFFGFSRDVTTTPTRLFRGVDELKKDTLGRFQPFLILLVLLVLAVFVLDWISNEISKDIITQSRNRF